MQRGVIYIVLAAVCCLSAFVMYQVGSHNGHLTEFRDYYYVPLPLAVVCTGAGIVHLTRKE
ncbi:MAG TPA: hypothetical protein VD905_00110 [Flavobacteriales bacterium]|nr:hypothetical protein [Flavobacteriales bacterium]